jgi:hypothetical protein
VNGRVGLLLLEHLTKQQANTIIELKEESEEDSMAGDFPRKARESESGRDCQKDRSVERRT